MVPLSVNDPEDNWDMEQALAGLEGIQADLNYQQARAALQELVGNLDLTAQERQGLEEQIQGLNDMLAKLDQQIVHIAVFGMVGRGKSSLLNAILGQPVFPTGAVHGVTLVQDQTPWPILEEGETRRVVLPGLGYARVELIDTPGIDEVDGEQREALAQQVAQQADLVLFVVAGDLTRVEYQALGELRQSQKPVLLVFNKSDQYTSAERQAICAKIRDERLQGLLLADDMVMAAASPRVPRLVEQPGGRREVELVVGLPQVEELKAKILQILDREGKSLLALNTMLYAGTVQEQIVQRKLTLRDEKANQLIWQSAVTKAVATALNPVTVLDMVSGGVIDVAMILALSRLYGLPMTRTAALALLQRIALSMGGISASELLVNLGLGSLKTLFGLAAPATAGLSLGAYTSVAITQAGVAGLSSYGIGQITKAYLANGARWGPEGPKAVVSRILSTLEETSILAQLKAELTAKLDLKPPHQAD